VRPTIAELDTLADVIFEVLERTGVKVLGGAAADALVAAGAEREGDRVRIPRRLVERALESAPQSFALHEADGRPAIELDGRHVSFGTGSDTPNVRDVATGERRPATLADIADAARVCDALPGIDFVMSLGPATLAGSVVVGAAECLSGLVIHQLARPGAPFIFGIVGSVMDMRTTVSAYGGAEFCLLNALATALGHHLGLPVFGTGGCTDAKVLDGQAAVEIATSLAAAHAAATDLVHDIGYLESGQTASLPAVVLADEIIRHLRRAERGVKIDPERLALDAIDRIGPGGHFIDDEHTVEHFRDEFLLDIRLDRRPFESWHSAGAPTLNDRLTAEVRRVLGQA